MYTTINARLLFLALISACIPGKSTSDDSAPPESLPPDSGGSYEGWPDGDGDGWGAGYPELVSPDTPGYAPQGGDCDDTDAAIQPEAEEIPDDGTDQDCDGMELCYADVDLDGARSDELVGTSDLDCAGEGVASADASLDCDDADGASYPGAEEACYDGVVNDCDGTLADAEAACSGELSGEVGVSHAGYELLQTYEDSGRTGYVLTGGGDLDGDGYTDVALGDWAVSFETYFEGAVYLFYGPITASHTLAEADATLEGVEYYENAGYSASIGPDIDGDGLDDLLVGSPGSFFGGEGAGAAQLVLGPVVGELELTRADGLLLGNPGDRAGTSVLLTADADADGVADLFVGGRPDETTTDGGAIWLIPGPGTGTTTMDEAAGDVVGQNDDALGESIAAGDVTGDGIVDLLIGGDRASCAEVEDGLAAIFDGPIDGVMSRDDADTLLCGEATFSDTGHTASMDGDIDGDGLNDVAVGSPGYGPLGSNQGAARLFLSPPTSWMALSDAVATLAGEANETLVGNSVSIGTDLDGDGLADLLVGAPYARGGTPWSGLALLYLGPVSGTLDLHGADLLVEGEDDGMEAGYAVANAGDTDGDGRDELLIGGPMSTTGRAWLVNGVEGI